jgi:deoxyribodipyrimidine photolyase-related protein
MPAELRHLVIVLGDQLNRDASAWDGFDPRQDAAWMAEVAEESTHAWSAKQRCVVFLAAMRHFAQALRNDQVPLHYRKLDDDGNAGTLAGELERTVRHLRPQRLRITEPGEWRVLQALQQVAQRCEVPLDIAEDRHFICSRAQFEAHAKGRKGLRMEYFYRELRRRHQVLMDGGEPAGGRWNFDADNRAAFDARGPGFLPPPTRFEPDAITGDVIALVNRRFADHPGSLASFGWPVTRAQALQVLQCFIDQRLESFGRYEDAMWSGEPWLYHSQLSAVLNLKLLDPREAIAAAEAAYRAGRVPLSSAEGFIRQIIGWREYVRGIYWAQMPGYLERNALAAHEPLPAFYWTGEVAMNCLRDAITQTLEHGYAHHIQRLMVTGLYALLLGVDPKAVHGWYLAVYVDAVEWVELPNTLGMSQFGDGGLMASKPYAASGKYIDRMSNHCRGCRFDPALRTGDAACPFTTLYWDFLQRHQDLLARNQRMALQVKNLARIEAPERRAIAKRAAEIRSGKLDLP